MGLWDKMKETKPSEGKNYLEPNRNYELEFLVMKTDTAREGYVFFIADFKVLGTDGSHKPGETVNFFVKGGDMFLPNVKALATSLLGSMAGERIDPMTVGEEEMLTLMGPPLTEDGKPAPGGIPGTFARGTRVRCRTRGIVTAKRKVDFTEHQWSPVFA